VDCEFQGAFFCISGMSVVEAQWEYREKFS
jgi:hypothetical protein